MSKIKSKNSSHSYLRAIQRCEWDKFTAKRMMKNASRYGKSYQNLEDGELKDFLKRKQDKTNRRVKYYSGYIFVFARNSTKCITVYPYKERN